MNTKNLDDQPAFIACGPTNVDGKESKMLTLILRTPPCAYNKCTMCGFANNASDSVRHEHIVKQYENSIKIIDLKGVEKLDYPTAGSFYNDAEMSPESRDYLFRQASKLPDVKHVMIETRAEYLTLEKVLESKKCLRDDQKLEIAIGLESANDRIRNKVLRKGLSKKEFEQFTDICQQTDSRLRAYVLIGSPTLTESEAIEDAVETAKYVYEVANARNIDAFIAFKPMFIPEGTELERQFNAGEYKLPTLWSVINVIKRTRELESYKANSIWVGMYDENLSNNRFTHNCGNCDQELSAAIVRFNGSQDISELETMTCKCKDEWEQKVGLWYHKKEYQE